MSTKMFLILGLLQLLLLSNFINGCPNNCDCVDDTLRCHGESFPGYIPNTISKVFLDSFNLNNLKSDLFTTNDWKNITTLDVTVMNVKFGEETIRNYTFTGLGNLEYIGLHGNNQLHNIESAAFVGLDNVLTLDLSDSFYLYVNDMIASLHGGDEIVLPKLQNLTLAKVQTYNNDPVTLDEYFFESLARGRHIKYLDFSYMIIVKLDMNYLDLELLCKSVEYAKAQKITIIYPKDYEQPSCSSLKTLDISGLNIPRLLRPIDFLNTEFRCSSMDFYYSIENLYMNNILIKNVHQDIVIKDYLLDLSGCPFHLKRIQFAGNTVKWINMSAILDQTTETLLEELDMSNNLMEYISPLTLFPSKNMQLLNMSYNHLNVMQEQYSKDFEQLFSSMTKLRRVNLSNNGLTGIPNNTFINNLMLEYLDLSYNKLTDISFNFEHLRQLKFLDLSHNLIKTIADNTRRHFESFLMLHYPDIGPPKSQTLLPAEMQVDLSSNDYQCECGNEYLQLIDWLKTSSVVYKENKTYKCILDGNRVDILNSAYEETQKYCYMKQVLQVLTIAIPVTLTVFLVIIITVVVSLRKYIKKKNVKNVLAQIQNNEFPFTYLVFLSYCNEDGNLVIDKMYPQLEQTIRGMTKSNKELVCLGDLHFRPGFAIHNEAMRCIENSAIVVLVVSNNFCQKNWCKMEVGEAYAQRKPIIMLMTERVNTELMSPFLCKIFNRYTRASWVNDDNGGHIEPNWARLCESMIELASEDQRENNIARRKPENEYQLNAL